MVGPGAAPRRRPQPGAVRAERAPVHRLAVVRRHRAAADPVRPRPPVPSLVEEARRELWRGRLPLVSERIGGGLPLLANGQTGAVGAGHAAGVGARPGARHHGDGAVEAGAGRPRRLSAPARGLPGALARRGGGRPRLRVGCYQVAWLLVPLAWVTAALPWVWWAVAGRPAPAGAAAVRDAGRAAVSAGCSAAASTRRPRRSLRLGLAGRSRSPPPPVAAAGRCGGGRHCRGRGPGLAHGGGGPRLGQGGAAPRGRSQPPRPAPFGPAGRGPAAAGAARPRPPRARRLATRRTPTPSPRPARGGWSWACWPPDAVRRRHRRLPGGGAGQPGGGGGARLPGAATGLAAGPPAAHRPDDPAPLRGPGAVGAGVVGRPGGRGVEPRPAAPGGLAGAGAAAAAGRRGLGRRLGAALARARPGGRGPRAGGRGGGRRRCGPAGWRRWWRARPRCWQSGSTRWRPPRTACPAPRWWLPSPPRSRPRGGG